MRIIELRAENFKRLVAIHIKPTGPVTPITGKNGQGKTSVLDAIASALGGGAQSPEMPVRKGQAKARVTVDLGDIVVVRKWSEKGTTSLEVTTKDGAAYKSPQAVLDKLVGELSFDPLAFGRMKPAEQAATLARVAQIDLDAHRTRRALLFSDRATANKTVKELKAQVSGMPEPAADLPEKEVSVAEIMEELKAAERAAKVRSQAEAEHKSALTDHALAQRRVEELAAQLELAKKALSPLLEEVHACARVLAETPRPPESGPIMARGREAEGINRQIRERDKRATKARDAEQLETLAQEITGKLDAHDAVLAAQLAEAKLPVPGLSLGEAGVLVAGIPFAQCSGAERLRVSVAIGLALNPKLRLMLIRDGSLLDDEGMRLLAELAEAADAQVLIERVDTGRGEVGVLIVDGHSVSEEIAAGAATEDAFPVA